MSTRSALLLVVLATAVVGVNGFKPLTGDDPIYYAYAAHIRAYPADPYGFLLFGRVPAMHVLVPPVLPYCLAAGMQLGGEQPWVGKLSLWPFGLVLVFSLFALFRRFAPGLEMPLVWLTACSPAFLPSWDLMLDLPALALGLAAVVLYLRAVDRSSLVLALVAGLVAGLGMQTKYTAFVVPAVLVIHGLLWGRPRFALAAALVAWLVFIGWEVWITADYGESHFLHHLHQRPPSPAAKLRLVLPLAVTLGGVFSCGSLLGLTALGARPRRVLAAALLPAAAYGFVILAPARWQALPGLAGEGRPLSVVGLLFALIGSLFVATVLAGGWRLCRQAWRDDGPPGRGRDGAVAWFLVAWLLLEVAGYFALSPFPAARRVLGIEVVATLLIGRLLAQGGLTAERRRLVWGIVGANSLLGLGFFAVDCCDARAGRAAAEEAVRWVRDQDSQGGVWYLGRQGAWGDQPGFGFYAERAGMKLPPADALLAPGDWLVVEQPTRSAAPSFLPPRRLLTVQDALPLRTYPGYYSSGTPLEHQDGPRFVVAIYRLGDPR